MTMPDVVVCVPPDLLSHALRASDVRRLGVAGEAAGPIEGVNCALLEPVIGVTL
ncbi:hypothetical protein AB0H43_37390 [Hamadaea sp. NPDC050747]|uniref:hypothetical protein n=1 Tax=Hamadaea sp. NPDC050747 TaxID=3155789 RepID=UPI0033D0A78F